MVQTTLYSMCSNEYAEHSLSLIGYLQAAEGGGIILGRLLSTALFEIGGYNFVF